MRITLAITKSVQDNANVYFEKAKKSKKKIEGARASIKRLQAQLEQVDQQREKMLQDYREKEAKRTAPKRQLHWFEKFRWFRSSGGFLCVGGRDATGNEMIVKKHAEKGDIVFHTEAPGSPFFVVKAEGKEIDADTIAEAGQAAASYSRAWRMAISAVEAYHVTPDQLSKEAPSGEYIQKGSFMVRGKRTTMVAKLGLAVGVTDDGLVMGGPLRAVKHHCKKFVQVALGDEKPSDAAKKIARTLGAEIDDVLRVLPAGNIKVLT